METTLPKYTPDDIERIFAERVQIHFHTPELKVGTLAEWKFTYPNGNETAQVEYSEAMHPENHDEENGRQVITDRIKRALWEICGKYTLATNEKL